MQSVSRRVRLVAAVVPLLLALAPRWPDTGAGADHGGALASPPMNPVLVGLAAAALVLAAGGLAMLIAWHLTRKQRPPSE